MATVSRNTDTALRPWATRATKFIWEAPDSREPRRTLDPRVAARSQWSRLEALLRNRSFRDAYAAARASFIAGVTSVLFPAGTYWLPRFANAPCEPHLSSA